jgi:photosystem II stability/assembly factor-like uncharacterized protein
MKKKSEYLFLHVMQRYLFLIASLMFSPSLNGQYFYQYLQEHPGENFYEIRDSVAAYYADKDKGRGSGYKQFRRWASNLEPYVYPSGEMVNYKARLNTEFQRYSQKLQMENKSSHGYWVAEGPDDYTLGWGWNGGNGRVNRITFHPTISSTFYLSTPAGGLWKTTDSGTTWDNMTDGMPTPGVSGFAINYNNTNIMYLLTGDGDDADSYSVGVLKSFDGGLNWVETSLSWDIPFLVTARKLIMHPTNPEIIFVAASNGLWRTIDGGNNWNQEQPGAFTDIEFRPGNPANMYATSTNAFWRSADTGDSWAIDGDTDFPTQYCRIEIGVTPNAQSYVYLLFGGHVNGTGNGHFSGLYRSSDYGSDFSLMSNYPNILGYASNGLDSANQACYDLAMAVDPNNVNTVYVGGINVWKSVNGGASWTILSHWVERNNTIGYTHADIHALEMNGSTLYCGSDGGIFSSNDGGSNWTNLSSGLSIMQFYYLDVENNIYAGGTQDNGCNQWISGSSSATHSIGADGFACLIDYNNTDIRYQSDQDNKYRSTNGGFSFTIINPPGANDYWMTDWIMDPINPARLFLAEKDIWRTVSGGVSDWTDLNAGFTNNNRIESMAIGVSDTNRLYASDQESIRTTTNVNASTPTWSDISTGLPFPQAMLSDIAVDPTNAQRIWVSFYGFVMGNKVFHSPNGGNNWFNESGNLPNVPVNAIIYQPGSNDGLYIGTDIGVFYQNDGIGDWIYFTNGMPTVRVFDLDIDSGFLYAATHGRGLWKTELYTTCANNLILTPGNDPGNENFTGVQRYHALNSILSNRIITGGLGTDVMYNAGTEIIFSSGFHARKDNLFEAKLGGCPE